MAYKVIYSERNVDYKFSPDAFNELIKRKNIQLKVEGQKRNIGRIIEEIANVTNVEPESVKQWKKRNGKGNGPGSLEMVKDIASYFGVDFMCLLKSCNEGSEQPLDLLISADNEKSIIIQFYKLMSEYIYTYLGNNGCEMSYAERHSEDGVDADNRAYDYIFNLYKQLDANALCLSDDSYGKIHRIISELYAMGCVGTSTCPGFENWLPNNPRWKEANSRLEIVLKSYAEFDGFYEAMEYLNEDEKRLLLNDYRKEVGQLHWIMESGDGVVSESVDDYNFYEPYEIVPMELAKALMGIFKSDFKDALK